MAERIDRLPTNPNVPGYQWDQWSDGEPWLLIEGEDFTCTRSSMETNVRRQARRIGKGVFVRYINDGPMTRSGLVIQFYDR
jgi:hypothetical protein